MSSNSKGTATPTRSQRADAVRRANRVAVLQWWLVAGLLLAAVVLMIVLFSQDGTGVPTHGIPSQGAAGG